jgi:glutathione S-transferase
LRLAASRFVSKEGRMKIYGRANSINVRKVLWIADEVGEPYTREDWGRGFRPTSDPEFQRISAFGVVPVIDDGGFILRESNTIVRYLAAKHARADLYPSGLRERASVESWMDWAATDLYQGVRPVFLGIVVKSPAFQDPKLIEAGIAEWSGQMRLLEAALARGGPFLAGSEFTVADIPAGLVVNRWFSIPFEKPALPAVAAYYDRLAERPAYRAWGRNGAP